jgi:hypothetical protein
MITQYFDINQRLVIQAPGTLAPASLQPWVYGDNYNLQIYLLAAGQFVTIGANDSLSLMLFQPAQTLPEQNLAIVSAPTINTDSAGFNYYLVNVNLKTTQLAALVQATNAPAKCEFHYIFTPASGERFSSSADVPVTVNPDPSESATGGTPVPPGYPTNPNVFEQIANKDIAYGYAGLDANVHLNPNEIPTDTTLSVVSGKLTVISAATGNPYVAVVLSAFAIPAEGVNTATLTLTTAAPDIIATETVLITDGARFMYGTVVSINGVYLVVSNNGLPGWTSGTMGANAHVYLGSNPGAVDTTKRGLVQILPLTNPTKQFYRADDSYAQANYPDLTNIPTSFPPGTHGSQHLSTGNDPVPLATAGGSGVAGLCPPPDGTTINVTGGKLTAVIPAGSQPYATTTAASFVLPAAGAGNAFNITITAAWADLVAGMSLLVTDGTHTCNLYLNSITGGTTLNVYNLGGGTAAGVTVAANAHVYMAVSEANPAPHAPTHLVGGADPIALASSSAAGLCPTVDNTTIQVSASKLIAVPATSTAAGIVKPDGTSTTVSAGTISVPTATAAALGLVKPDGSTITVDGTGKIAVPTATPSLLGLVKPDGTSILDTAGAISVPTATTAALGLVKPDGSTITIDGTGKISSSGGGGGAGDTTTTTAAFTMPTINQVVAGVTVASASWMLVGKAYFIVGSGNFLCTAISSNTISLQNTGDIGNATSGASVPSGSLVMPAPDRGDNVFWDIDEMDWGAGSQSIGNNGIAGRWGPATVTGTISTGNGLGTAGGYSTEQGDVGIIFSTSTSATGYAQMQHSSHYMLAGSGGGNNIHLFHWRIWLNTVSNSLSSATQRYLIGIGLYDVFFVPTTNARRIAFSYTDTVNAGDWTCEYLKNGGTLTQHDSGVAVALSTAFDLYIIVDPTNIYWLIGTNNAAPVQVWTTPVSNASAGTTNGFSPWLGIQKSIGTTGCTFNCDLFERAVIWKYASTPRYTFRGLVKSGS